MRKRVSKVFSKYPLQMITLDTYAQHVYQYAAPATSEHLRRTVWEPLGLSPKPTQTTATTSTLPCNSHASLYAVPPVTTNLRCTGTNIENQLRHFIASAAATTTTASTATGVTHPSATCQDGTGEASPASPATAAAARYVPIFTFDRLGLPFCACVQPDIRLLAQWPPAFSLPAPASATAATEPSVAPLVIVVDAGAAEAVLRGSDLYAPGVVTASRVFSAGEEALVAFYAERVTEAEESSNTNNRYGNNPPPGARKKAREEGHAATVTVTARTAPADGPAHPPKPSAAAWHIVSALTAGVTLPPAQYTPLLTAADTSAAALEERSSFLVCVGCGRLEMGWKDVLGRRARGVALRTDWTPQLQPSRATLRRLLGTASLARSPVCPASDETAEQDRSHDEPRDVFFLQNYSSMVPVSLLVEHLPAEAFTRSCTVLDACAAPGGKTSLLLSLLQARAAKKEIGAAEQRSGTTNASLPPFRVVCCERSRPRQEQLMKLLQEHFAGLDERVAGRADLSSRENDGSYLSHVLEPHCIDTNKFLKKLAAGTADADVFDAVLLDPPCTGLGLRPKLLPHVHSIASIQQSADYQRKLFDSCVRHVRCSATSPGVIVYSTCTTTLEENEGNVVHFLRTYPFIRLARATTSAHAALCRMSVTTYPHRLNETDHGNEGHDGAAMSKLLLAQEILGLQREKEAAAASTATPARTSDAPLLALRFMPRALCEYGDPSEDSVGFFVAVFLCHGHGNR